METEVSQQIITLNGKPIIIETGRFAVQANGAVTARCGDTIVLATAVSGRPREGLDYFPLQIEYREKHYAGGIISSSRFVKREGKPSDNEILTSRLIDRSVRPLFPEDYMDEVQVVVNPLSIDGENEPEILGIIAASAALRLSDIPWNGPVGAVRIGIDAEDKFIVNPSNTEKETSRLDLVVSGGKGSIAMVEAGASEVTEKEILAAMKFGQEQIDSLITQLDEWASKIAQPKREVKPLEVDQNLEKLVSDKFDHIKFLADITGNKQEKFDLSPVVSEIVGDDEEIDRGAVFALVDQAIKKAVRAQVLEKGVRFDGRKADQIRDIRASVGLLPRTHGSGFFQRGLTHALSVVTLGSPEVEQLIEGMKGESTKRYMHHYNMPPFSNGEPGRYGFPSRREVGHGALAERAIEPILPPQEEFPYTIRVVSEIISSNGSTSQASICGSTLSLMDAGVPIKKPVAGIAMGLITDGEKNVTLSDIAGAEDHFGDMDFKVAGTRDGITAMQMDVKISGVSADIMETALEQARLGRLHILDKMLEAISEPRVEISQFAPRIEFLKIDPEKIGTVIGSGGKTIRQIQDQFKVEVGVDDDGSVNITGLDGQTVKDAVEYIKNLVAGPEVGKVYDGTVKRLMDFGAFVEFLPGQEGLVHLSNMGKGFVEKASDVVNEGDSVQVKVYEVDPQGRVNLTMDLENEPSKGRGGGGGSSRGGGFRDRGPREHGSREGGSRDRGQRDSGPRGSKPGVVFDRSERPRTDSSKGRGGRGGESRFKRFADHR
jgi:polyribonucleotide nucleotidyltransferase